MCTNRALFSTYIASCRINSNSAVRTPWLCPAQLRYAFATCWLPSYLHVLLSVVAATAATAAAAAAASMTAKDKAQLEEAMTAAKDAHIAAVIAVVLHQHEYQVHV